MKNIILFSLLAFVILSCSDKIKNEKDYVIFEANPKTENIKFYWKNDSGQVIKSINNLKKHVESKNENLKFAMNGGMFEINNIPKGLYIENFKILNKIDTSNGNGNFYLQPNGVFYLTKNNEAKIVETQKFRYNSNIEYATQSGPMLLINGNINPIFQEQSTNVNIRNGVGILENGNIVFVMSKTKVNFYNFALLFKELGCKNALYLDGFVSRTYLPEKKWMQEDGDFGVMIGVTDSEK
ncbi:phosphodiester glycosidase family protein [Epilithonimonas ginsengisoli]|uniref:Phosphodiester glycosidase family protein n=1 Tax=Epilithonimonas ginsengisoli TaxID=1245592 RepID=A0ABU4JCW9_9FLAO|nr:MULTISPECIES: phosphodiester glycosidase family protein [Chryseobacterium group]MBV6878261.1 phosphodiester glycosidase family protein [Epilithonimonas sp. FP105]MDW8547498.1 phosphodiester glycosidase family protein [Epilithonimonas ginsengisoli]OAH68916.1 hypothetical protein AXA65_15875 [Chryseobacterium sp. FP211-J200]